MEKISSPHFPSDSADKEALLWLGELAIMHVGGEKTNGRYAMLELYATKEGEVPWHVHHQEDEAFYLIEGEMSIYVGDTVHKVRPGDFVLAPKDIPHRYTVDSAGYARVLMTFSPSGFEGFVRATSTPAASLVPPPPGSISIDFEEVARLTGQFGAEFVEPPTD